MTYEQFCQIARIDDEDGGLCFNAHRTSIRGLVDEWIDNNGIDIEGRDPVHWLLAHREESELLLQLDDAIILTCGSCNTTRMTPSEEMVLRLLQKPDKYWIEMSRAEKRAEKAKPMKESA